MPRLKGVSFETAIIERYRRRESSVEEALIEMYLAGVSVRRVEDITEALWGSKVSPSTISELNKKAYVHIEDWRNRPLQGGKYPYVYVDGIYLRRNWGGEYENVAILVAIAVNEDGYREVLGAAEGMKEDKASWVSFFQWLKGRGLEGVKLIVGDKCLGMLEAVSTSVALSTSTLRRAKSSLSTASAVREKPRGGCAATTTTPMTCSSAWTTRTCGTCAASAAAIRRGRSTSCWTTPTAPAPSPIRGTHGTSKRHGATWKRAAAHC